MMKNRYLICPQCNSPKFYVKNKNGEMVFFKVQDGGKIELSENSIGKDEGADFSVISCTGCSWEGRINKLIK